MPSDVTSVVLTSESYASLFGPSPPVPWAKVVEHAAKHKPKSAGSGLSTSLRFLGIFLGFLASIAALALSSSIAGWPAPLVISYAYAAMLLRFATREHLRAPLQTLAVCFFTAAQAILTANVMDDIFGYCFVTFLMSLAFASLVYLKVSKEPLVAALAYLLHFPFVVCLLSILAGATVPEYEYADDGTSSIVGQTRSVSDGVLKYYCLSASALNLLLLSLRNHPPLPLYDVLLNMAALISYAPLLSVLDIPSTSGALAWLAFALAMALYMLCAGANPNTLTPLLAGLLSFLIVVFKVYDSIVGLLPDDSILRFFVGSVFLGGAAVSLIFGAEKVKEFVEGLVMTFRQPRAEEEEGAPAGVYKAPADMALTGTAHV
ncbi:hypothetical protein TrVE_jg4337 [Triparma verrucosa]|uniref:Uncharacterized protein n=1 Tax=Triparma verrucosa TaxID=1606542 RepID=A0A9W7C1Z6_9STRA|nr:hypothetical protein TrVE_jg4337 [Triparma verrucosa]